MAVKLAAVPISFTQHELIIFTTQKLAYVAAAISLKKKKCSWCWFVPSSYLFSLLGATVTTPPAVTKAAKLVFKFEISTGASILKLQDSVTLI